MMVQLFSKLTAIVVYIVGNSPLICQLLPYNLLLLTKVIEDHSVEDLKTLATAATIKTNSENTC